MLEALAAGILGAVLLSLVLAPILITPRAPDPSLLRPELEETARGQALIALKEIEFDRATGKLSDEDYAALTARYAAAALGAPGDDTLLPRCPVHGPRAEAEARFCAECGAALTTPGEGCAACGHALPPDARFCPDRKSVV